MKARTHSLTQFLTDWSRNLRENWTDSNDSSYTVSTKVINTLQDKYSRIREHDLLVSP